MRQRALWISGMALVWTGAMVLGAAGAAAAPVAPPVVVGEGEPQGPQSAEAAPATAQPPLPVGDVRADAETHTVRFAVALGSGRGLVEWLLVSGGRHRAMSTLVTGQSVRTLAEAFEKAAFPVGRPPATDAEGHLRMPTGAEVEIDLVVTGADGKEVRYPASRLLSEKEGGDPLPPGRWIYVGPQVVHDDEGGDLLLSQLSGSLATPNLRDTSAFLYWVSEGQGTEAAGRAYYASAVAAGLKDGTLAIEVRLRPPPPPPPVEAPSESPAAAPEVPSEPAAPATEGAESKTEAPAAETSESAAPADETSRESSGSNEPAK